MAVLKHIQKLPLGYSEARYNNKKYSINKSEFNNGNSFKIYAKELGGNDFISLNYYVISKGGVLKPCEMPEKKVIHFLSHMEAL